ncbi:SgcJ/EcaC family oxidoreductase [Streptomyces sp. NPDC049577]|uniref:SgcJ/EcaC family oxidoreductase n=1 Tax=Streptomyces sp. NPDC049577 TaxID=3155153 RepID=UPI003415C594
MRRTCSALAAVAAAATLFTGIPAAAAAAAPVRLPTARGAVADSSRPPTERQIKALFDRWNAALATGDARRVADLYAPDAVLLPTVSPEIRTTRAGIVDYFEHFLEGKPVGTVQERFINIPNRNTAIDTGLYRFTLTNEDGSTSEVDARYTFVYELRGDDWLIVNHHSSKVPEG